jgi:hypothetical protein
MTLKFLALQGAPYIYDISRLRDKMPSSGSQHDPAEIGAQCCRNQRWMEAVYCSRWRGQEIPTIRPPATIDSFHLSLISAELGTYLIMIDSLMMDGILKCRNMQENVEYQYTEGLMHLLVFSLTVLLVYLAENIQTLSLIYRPSITGQ